MFIIDIYKKELIFIKIAIGSIEFECIDVTV